MDISAPIHYIYIYIYIRVCVCARALAFKTLSYIVSLRHCNSYIAGRLLVKTIDPKKTCHISGDLLVNLIISMAGSIKVNLLKLLTSPNTENPGMCVGYACIVCYVLCCVLCVYVFCVCMCIVSGVIYFLDTSGLSIWILYSRLKEFHLILMSYNTFISLRLSFSLFLCASVCVCVCVCALLPPADHR